MIKYMRGRENKDIKVTREDKRQDKPGGKTPVIALKEAWKTYRTGAVELTALKGVTLHIYAGEFTAVMGPSGSGKSTLMNVIGCLDEMDSGSYYLKGININNLNQEDLAFIRNQEIGIVFQSFNLLNKLTLQENVELPLIYGAVRGRERNARALKALESVGLSSWARHRPGEVSGGQIQRAAIARALVMQPAILMADEPTGNLDSQTSRDIMEVFRQLNREGSTIVLITHEKEVAAYASRIIQVEDGKILQDSIGRDAPKTIEWGNHNVNGKHKNCYRQPDGQ